MTTERGAIVVELPQRLSSGHVQAFLHSSKALLTADRPRLIFDFSQVRSMDGAGAEMLLHCMERITRQDGDLKLAAVRPEIAIVMELTCIARLFEIFDSTAEAVESFNTFSAEIAQRRLGMLQPVPVLVNDTRTDDLPMAS